MFSGVSRLFGTTPKAASLLVLQRITGTATAVVGARIIPDAVTWPGDAGGEGNARDNCAADQLEGKGGSFAVSNRGRAARSSGPAAEWTAGAMVVSSNGRACQSVTLSTTRVRAYGWRGLAVSGFLDLVECEQRNALICSAVPAA